MLVSVAALVAAGGPDGAAGAATDPPAPSWTITTVAAPFVYPDALAADGNGNVYVADAGTGAVYAVAPDGAVTTVAVHLSDPRGVAVDSSGDVFVADTGHDRVVEVAAGSGALTTVAGSGTWGFTPDGAPAAGAAVEGPAGVAVDGAGDVFFSEGAANRIRKVDAATGALVTVGGSGIYGSSGDGGPAPAAQLAGPAALAFGPSADLFFVEAGDSRVRALTTSGTVVAVAGKGGRAENGDGGSALHAQLDGPTGVAVDARGDVLVSEGPGERVREVAPATGVIYTVGGTGAPGAGDGGPAASAPLHDPEAVAVTPAGLVVVADAANRALRGFVPPAPQGCAGRLPAGRVVGAAAPAAPANPASPGYLLAAADGAVATFGPLTCSGSELGGPLAQPVVAGAATPDGGGYWLASAGGGVFSFGDAGFFGSAAGTRLTAPVVALAPTRDGRGYWLVAADGGVFSFGDAGFHGGVPGTPAAPLNRPIVALVPTPDGGGYWLGAADGGVFTFGDAPFLGSLGGLRLARPIVGAAGVPNRSGLWMVAADGGIFTFGAAPFFGSGATMALGHPVVGMAPSPDGGGYWIVTSNGGVFTFGDAPFAGSAA
ncbi:MAG TPA: hypothetical protein VFW24_00860 [Acidimicrobiales bacterium]|nr:hypothetical protein [Acidimicrobiales bacterium]